MTNKVGRQLQHAVHDHERPSIHAVLGGLLLDQVVIAMGSVHIRLRGKLRLGGLEHFRNLTGQAFIFIVATLCPLQFGVSDISMVSFSLWGDAIGAGVRSRFL